MNINPKTLAIIAIVILAIAILPLPVYGYYVFSRITVTLIAVYLAVQAYKKDNSSQLLFMVGIAILYNPIIPIHLTKPIWVILNMLTAAIFYREYIANKK